MLAQRSRWTLEGLLLAATGGRKEEVRDRRDHSAFYVLEWEGERTSSRHSPIGHC